MAQKRKLVDASMAVSSPVMDRKILTARELRQLEEVRQAFADEMTQLDLENDTKDDDALRLRRIKRYTNRAGVTRMKLMPEFASHVNKCKSLSGNNALPADSFHRPGKKLAVDSYKVWGAEPENVLYAYDITPSSISVHMDNAKKITVYADGNVLETYYECRTGLMVASLLRIHTEGSSVGLILKTETQGYMVKQFKAEPKTEIMISREDGIQELGPGSIVRYLNELERSEKKLMRACHARDWPIAFQYLHQKQGLYYKRNDDHSPFTIALALKAPTDLLVEMINKGCRVTGSVWVDCRKQCRIARFAVYKSADTQVLSMIFRRVEKKLRDEMLHNAIDCCAPTPIIRALIEAGADVNLHLADAKMTILIYAIHHLAPYSTVQLLVENGARVNDISLSNTVALAMVAWRTTDSKRTMMLLLENGADPNLYFGYDPAFPLDHQRSMTPFHFYCQRGNADAVAILLDWGGQVDALDSFGISPFRSAKYQGHDEVLEMLIPFVTASDPFLRFCRGQQCSLSNCQEKSVLQCPHGCEIAQYCCVEHQKLDWDQFHNHECMRIKEERNRDKDTPYIDVCFVPANPGEFDLKKFVFRPRTKPDPAL